MKCDKQVRARGEGGGLGVRVQIPTSRKFRVTLKFQERNPYVSRKLSAASHKGNRNAPSIDSWHRQVEYTHTRNSPNTNPEEKTISSN
jgi:hypothetical protein